MTNTVIQSSVAVTNPPIAMLGVPFDNVTTTEAMELIERMIASRRPHYLITANVDFLVQAREDVELRRIFFDADLVLCDGTPLLWASRLLGNPLPERVAGADLVPLLIRLAAERGYRLFLLGATPASSSQAVAKLTAAYPNLIIAGHYSPPFNKLLEMDHEEIARRIREAKPDLLFVSFGCPKQEKWIAMHYRALRVPVAAGVGATIDFLAGNFKRAPVWMQRSGTEWIFRMAQEPRRLVRRYVKDIGVFGRGILSQWWQLQFRARRAQRGDVAAPVPTMKERGEGQDYGVPPPVLSGRDSLAWQLARLPERLDLAAVREMADLVDRILADGRHCVLEMAGIQFIDSTGVGLLIRLQKKIQAAGRQLVLLAPSAITRRTLALMRLQDFFASAPDIASAQSLIKTRSREQFEAVSLQSVPTNKLVWRGEITAANAEEIWERTRSHIELTPEPPAWHQDSTLESLITNHRSTAWEHEPAGMEHESPTAEAAGDGLIIDLTEVRFIDSSGLSLMIRARKLAQRHGAKLFYTGIQPAVRNVLHLARLEEFLLGEEPARR